MSCKTETKQIGELSLTTVQFPSLRALSLATELGAVLIPALASLQGDVKSIMGSDLSVIAPALRELFIRLDEKDSAQLAIKILSNSYAVKDGNRIELSSQAAIDSVFSGHLSWLFQAMVFAIQVNFADFLDGALSGNLNPA